MMIATKLWSVPDCFSIERITHNIEQIRTLEKLRVTLLTNLMSGKVRVGI